MTKECKNDIDNEQWTFECLNQKITDSDRPASYRLLKLKKH